MKVFIDFMVTEGIISIRVFGSADDLADELKALRANRHCMGSKLVSNVI